MTIEKQLLLLANKTILKQFSVLMFSTLEEGTRVLLNFLVDLT